MRTRKAVLPDAPAIFKLISQYTGDGTLLPRSLQEICENVRDFTVVEYRGRVIACAALHIYGIGLAEVRSVAVDKASQGRNAGRHLVEGLLSEAQVHEIERVFLFTRVPDFFAKLGFLTVPHHTLPEKVHKDCLNCSRRHNCDEIAMVLDQEGVTIAMPAEASNPLRVFQ
ncbi:MAG TPA: N-acetyltransferase [Terriglobales bacterium]|nr:N-acetyltransferase [Terriglobales bacterium]